MPGPHIAAKGQRQTAEQQKVDLLEHFFFGDSPRRYGPVGLVDRVEVLVVPVVDRLAEARQEGTGQDHARRRLGEVFRAFCQRAADEGPAVVSRSCRQK